MKNRSSDSPSKEALDGVREVYRELEQRPVERNCIRRTECCHFQITGKVPQLTMGEALVLAKGVRASGRKTVPEAPSGACPLLEETTGKCMAYDARPFGCRTHFCKAAGGVIPRSSILDLIRRLEEIDATLGGDGPRSLPSALRDALRRIA